MDLTGALGGAGSTMVAGPAWAEVFLRWALASPFAYSAMSKGLNAKAAIAEFRSLGLPRPDLLVWPTVVFQGGCAALLILGVLVPPVALALAGFTIVATLLAHKFWRETGPARDRQLTTSLEHLALVAALVYVAMAALSSGGSLLCC